MIEIVSRDRCVRCDVCVDVCPTDVFDLDDGGFPVIARGADCQTCFLCEAYCPTDALYVAPFARPAAPGSAHTDEDRMARRGALGDYRARVGWGLGRVPGSALAEGFRFTGSG
ncbi:ferredoxin family protein [Pseudonocardia sp. NPDC046786]|uniref:ferredoxin family protein n=1 Tax=Pseudonocardia sp. NPDC046786 TaxID=3155471 RepID=UPI0033CEC740